MAIYTVVNPSQLKIHVVSPDVKQVKYPGLLTGCTPPCHLINENPFNNKQFEIVSKVDFADNILLLPSVFAIVILTSWAYVVGWAAASGSIWAWLIFILALLYVTIVLPAIRLRRVMPMRQKDGAAQIDFGAGLHDVEIVIYALRVSYAGFIGLWDIRGYAAIACNDDSMVCLMVHSTEIECIQSLTDLGLDEYSIADPAIIIRAHNRFRYILKNAFCNLYRILISQGDRQYQLR